MGKCLCTAETLACHIYFGSCGYYNQIQSSDCSRDMIGLWSQSAFCLKLGYCEPLGVSLRVIYVLGLHASVKLVVCNARSLKFTAIKAKTENFEDQDSCPSCFNRYLLFR